MRNVSIANDPIPAQSARRGNTTKAILITLAVVAVIMILSCAGAGVAVYVFVHRTLANLAVTDPVQLRQMTSEMIDITVPAQFVPQNGSSLMGMTTVVYTWCPSGTNCPPTSDSHLTITSFGANEPPATADDSKTEVDEMIKGQFREFTRDDREFDIRGQKVQFAFVLGEESPYSSEEDDEVTAPGQTGQPKSDQPAATDPSNLAVEPATPADAPDASPDDQSPQPDLKKPDPTQPATPGRKIWWIYGKVPGKKAPCTIHLQMTPELYDEQLIMNMLKSIR